MPFLCPKENTLHARKQRKFDCPSASISRNAKEEDDNIGTCVKSAAQRSHLKPMHQPKPFS